MRLVERRSRNVRASGAAAHLAGARPRKGEQQQAGAARDDN
jgi:hypothetical protein